MFHNWLVVPQMQHWFLSMKKKEKNVLVKYEQIKNRFKNLITLQNNNTWS